MIDSGLAEKNKMNSPKGKTWSDAPSMKQEQGDSATQDTAAHSGSRPTPSKYKIDTSAPMDPHTQGRAPEGWLK